MLYLTEQEYKDMGFAEISGSFSFDQLLKRTAPLIDVVTRDFYQKYDIKTDIKPRVDKFKRALCAQIEFFDETGKVTSEGLNNVPQSQSIGDTTITMTGGRNGKGSKAKSLVCDDAYFYLSGTGLLSRGVG